MHSHIFFQGLGCSEGQLRLARKFSKESQSSRLILFTDSIEVIVMCVGTVLCVNKPTKKGSFTVKQGFKPSH